MSGISWPNVLSFRSDLADVDLDQQALILEWCNARFAAILDGELGPTTRLARILAAAHLASRPGSGEQRSGGPITSQSRGGLRVTFAEPSQADDSSWRGTQWGERLLALLASSRASWPRTP